MKLLIASFMILSATFTARADDAAPAPAAVACKPMAKELYAGLDKATEIMATPQEYWKSKDIDFVFDIWEKYAYLKSTPAKK